MQKKHASTIVAQGKALYDGYHVIYQPHDCLLNYICKITNKNTEIKAKCCFNTWKNYFLPFSFKITFTITLRYYALNVYLNDDPSKKDELLITFILFISNSFLL